jgi:hypothetical protein
VPPAWPFRRPETRAKLEMVKTEEKEEKGLGGLARAILYQCILHTFISLFLLNLEPNKTTKNIIIHGLTIRIPHRTNILCSASGDRIYGAVKERAGGRDPSTQDRAWRGGCRDNIRLLGLRDSIRGRLRDVTSFKRTAKREHGPII